MSKEKKELNDEELKSVNGGYRNDSVRCKSCGSLFYHNDVENRRVGGYGCDPYYEHKCPYCGNWHRYI